MIDSSMVITRDFAGQGALPLRFMRHFSQDGETFSPGEAHLQDRSAGLVQLESHLR